MGTSPCDVSEKDKESGICWKEKQIQTSVNKRLLCDVASVNRYIYSHTFHIHPHGYVVITAMVLEALGSEE